jgi:hypothetical protein
MYFNTSFNEVEREFIKKIKLQALFYRLIYLCIIKTAQFHAVKVLDK